LAERIGEFQQACREAARRVGLVPFGAAPAEPFDARKHRAHGVEHPPAEAVIAELLAPGLTYQSRLVRPALVRLGETEPSAAPPAPASPAADPGEWKLEPAAGPVEAP